MIYVWECPSCNAQTKINYDANEEQYLRISQCVCGDRLIWKENVENGDTE
jgi:hypothetical protein